MHSCPWCGSTESRMVGQDVYECQECFGHWEEWGHFPSEDEGSTNKAVDQAERNQRINNKQAEKHAE